MSHTARGFLAMLGKQPSPRRWPQVSLGEASPCDGSSGVVSGPGWESLAGLWSSRVSPPMISDGSWGCLRAVTGLLRTSLRSQVSHWNLCCSGGRRDSALRVELSTRGHSLAVLVLVVGLPEAPHRPAGVQRLFQGCRHGWTGVGLSAHTFLPRKVEDSPGCCG